METDREAKRRRQQLGRRGRRKTVEERQIGEQGEGNKNNEGEEEVRLNVFTNTPSFSRMGAHPGLQKSRRF